jgi:hypothetical protein
LGYKEENEMASLGKTALGECFPGLESAVAPVTQIIAIEKTQDIFEPDVDIGNREQVYEIYFIRSNMFLICYLLARRRQRGSGETLRWFHLVF